LLNLNKYIINSYNHKSKDKTAPLYISHTANFVYKLLFDHANANYDSYFLKYKNNVLDYDQIFIPNSDSNRQFKWMYDLMLDNIKNHYIQLKTPNIVNTSEYLLNRFMFFITSSRSFQDINRFLNENNKNDVSYLNAPITNNSSQKDKGSFLLQGLNLIGIKKFNKSDKVAKNFVHWLLHSNEQWKDENTTLNMIPAEYLDYKLGYVYPSDKYYRFIADKANSNPTILNLFNLLNDKNITPFQEPVDSKSDLFRTILQNLLNDNLYYSLALKGENQNVSFDDFLIRIKDVFE
ncbi:hypothetical protein, partial [Metamycoplasma neophronis]